MIHLVVSCTQAKRYPAPPERRFGQFRHLGREERRARWVEALESTPREEAVPARDLYKGDHWQVSCKAADASGASLWVCSAGYGLLSSRDRVASYSATFSAPSQDAVAGSRSQRLEWWRGLTQWQRRGSRVGSLTDLAASDPHGSILVAASPAYLDAIADDVLGAAALLVDPDRLVIISVGTKRGHALSGFVVFADARHVSRLRGTVVSLNARLAAEVLTRRGTGPLSRRECSEHLTRVSTATPQFSYPERQKSSDDEVREFIIARLRQHPASSHTRLLRDFRSSGRACEQLRFATLFGQCASLGGQLG
jgi:hypothetical protein